MYETKFFIISIIGTRYLNKYFMNNLFHIVVRLETLY